MAMRPSPRPESPEPSEDVVVEEKLMRFAEQLGYVVGTIHGKAEGWLNRDALRTQLTGVRDSASDLLQQIIGSVPTRQPTGRAKSSPKAARAAKTPDPVHAPGKRHRKPAAGPKGVKHSDERIAKLKNANAARQRRKY
jgi:hypothetical protein